jgi:DNA polymerase-3 subunit delta
MMRAFSQADRFFSELESRKLKPAYVLVGDEAFFRKRCRDAILEHLVAPDSRDFGLFEFDLAETSLNEVLDRARTPSLMAPFQVFFVRGVKTLFGRGSNEEKIGAIEAYCKNPNPDALLVFVADHISIPADARRMEMTDRDRYQKIREDLGPFCGIVELSRVEEGEAVRWIGEYCVTRAVKIDADGARELVDALGGDMMMVSNELEKLILYVGEKKQITLGDVETMVLAAKQRSLYELTDAISSKDRVRALEVLDACFRPAMAKKLPSVISTCWPRPFARCWSSWSATCATSACCGRHCGRAFACRPFAADDIIRQARRYKSKRELTRAIRLVAKGRSGAALESSRQAAHPRKAGSGSRGEPKLEATAGGWMQEELPV